MSDILNRAQAPLTPQEWQSLEQTVVQVARRNLVARRFLTIFGPVGAGLQSVAADTFAGDTRGQISLLGGDESDLITVQSRRFQPVPVLNRDFRLEWRDLEAARRFGMPLETTAAAIAAAAVASIEDRVIFNGYDEFQQTGFLNVPGRQQLPLGNWGTTGGGFSAVVSAVRALAEHLFRGPFTVALPPQLFVEINRVFDNTGILEIDQIRRLVGGGVYMATALPENTAVVVAAGQENMDLLIAQDMTVAFLETTAMEHNFRVLEALTLRVKRPGAVATLGQI